MRPTMIPVMQNQSATRFVRHNEELMIGIKRAKESRHPQA
jgi:hypothetical protein